MKQTNWSLGKKFFPIGSVWTVHSSHGRTSGQRTVLRHDNKHKCIVFMAVLVQPSYDSQKQLIAVEQVESDLALGVQHDVHIKRGDGSGVVTVSFDGNTQSLQYFPCPKAGRVVDEIEGVSK